MRKIAVLFPLALLGAASPAERSPPQPQSATPIEPLSRALPNCREFRVAGGDGRAAFHRLGELPSANAYKAVLRAGEDGCPDPLVVSYGHGLPSGPTIRDRR